MENALAPAAGPAATTIPNGGAQTSGGLGGFPNPLRQIGDFLSQPAIKRALPMIFMIGLVAAAALAYLTLRTPPQRVLFSSLSDGDKAAVTQALTTAGIDNEIDDSGSVTVSRDEYNKARMLLASQNLPKAAPGGYDLLDNLPMGVSRAVEGEKLQQARETELAKSIEEIDAVADARVHLAIPEASAFVRDQSSPSASVILRLEPGRALSDAQVRSIVNLVASSVPGMKPDAVTIVDQMGTLLSQPGSGDTASSLGDQRLDFQDKIESQYRQQIAKLLTPLVGAGNFSAEVDAAVDLDENQATRESYDKDGQLSSEQGNWQAKSDDPAAGGIPGALSNTPPPPSAVVDPTKDPKSQTGDSSGAPDTSGKSSEQYARTYDHGKEISVTRAMPGAVKRLSVAVLLRQTDGKPRSKAEIDQITQLVRAAVGYDVSRNDQVTVISRQFSPDAIASAEKQAWYQADWVPLVARNGTALVIALLVLLLGVRPLAKVLLKKREDADPANRPALGAGGAGSEVERETPGETPVSVKMLASSQSYEDRLGLVRGFTRDNPARAAMAVRDMIRSDTAE